MEASQSSKSTVYVQVVFLRRNIENSFTYKIDTEESTSSLLGQPVVVPLGETLTVGLIHGTCDAPENSDSIKEIKELISDVGSINRELIELGEWVSDYYLTPLNTVFSSILPPRYLPEPEWSYQWDQSIHDKDDFQQLEEIFGNHNEMSRAEVDKVLSDQNYSELSREDIEEFEPISKTVKYGSPGVESRKLNYVRLLEQNLEDEAWEENLALRQRELIDYLFATEGHGDYQKNLPDELRRTDLLKRLKELGYLERDRRILRRIPLPSERGEETIEDFELTSDQKQVFDSVQESIKRQEYRTHLVHGVTGSGKTEVYFRLIEEVLSEGENALVLVPEITLASFMISEFRSRFGSDLAILHSGLSSGERYDEWKRTQNGEARVVLGVQSSIFAPLPDLGLIVVDEEHDSSYKSGQSPRYNARDLAVVRGRIADIPVVLGSATPSLESYTNGLKGHYDKHDMTQRPLGGELPEVEVIDLKGEDSLLTKSLIKNTAEVLDRGNRAIWFYNRRGASNFLLCNNCGEVVECQNCNVSLTVHDNPRTLRCHYCGFSRTIPEVCSNCGEETVEAIGSGTQTLARRARNLFDNTTVIRLDQDTVTEKNSRYEKLQSFGNEQPCLMIGTQMVTKGLDYEDVDFVGVVLADTGLQFPDFRSGEKTFQQLVQVCGRAGRKKRGAVVQVQTYNPGHYAILYGKRTDYESFATEELKNRKPLQYPPFARLINVVARGKRKKDVNQALNKLRENLPEQDSVQFLGPSPCGVDYVKGNYRWHLMIRGHFSSDWKNNLRKQVNKLNDKLRIIVDVDPIDIH